MAGEEKTPKILLVEDDVFMVDLLAREFKGAGFEVLVAKTGSEGVEKFREAKPDLILLDIMLPGLNGFDALRQIRREEKGPTTKVIVLSNLGDVSDKEEAKRLKEKIFPEFEMGVLKKYLPPEISDEDLLRIVRDGIREAGATNTADFPKVMKAIMPTLKGKASGDRISQAVKNELSKFER